jgi:hypothetical protein
LVEAGWGPAVTEQPGTNQARLAGSMPGGAHLLEVATGRAWVLDDTGTVAALGAALAWARRRDIVELHVLVDEASGSGTAAAVMARRASQWSGRPRIWTVSGRTLQPARVAPVPAPSEPSAQARAMTPDLVRHGADVVVEHGVIMGEVRGLEVARVVSEQEGERLAVGVGRQDQEAREQLHPEETTDDALARVIGVVRSHRVVGRPRHPANTLARERWMRAALLADPGLVGASELRIVSPPLPREGLLRPGVAPAIGRSRQGESLMVVCSTGANLDLVPAAADARHLAVGSGPSSATPPRLLLVLPEGDDHQLIRDLAGDLGDPADVMVIAPGWESVVG